MSVCIECMQRRERGGERERGGGGREGGRGQRERERQTDRESQISSHIHMTYVHMYILSLSYELIKYR